MAFYSVCGLPGSGKSLYQLHRACELANRKRTILVSNLALDLEHLHKYCGLRKFGWLAHQIEMDRIFCLPGIDNVEELFGFKRATIILDEAGVFFNSRAYAKMPPSILASMAQLRHDANDLIWAAQYFDQVDRAFRMLSCEVTHAAGQSSYSKILKNEQLRWRKWLTFDPASYEKWLNDKKARSPGLGGYFRTKVIAKRIDEGMLRACDRQAFKAFSSFDRVEDGFAKSNPYTLHLKPFHQVSQLDVEPDTFAKASRHPLSDREIKLINFWRTSEAVAPRETHTSDASDAGARSRGSRTGAKAKRA